MVVQTGRFLRTNTYIILSHRVSCWRFVSVSSRVGWSLELTRESRGQIRYEWCDLHGNFLRVETLRNGGIPFPRSLVDQLLGTDVSDVSTVSVTSSDHETVMDLLFPTSPQNVPLQEDGGRNRKDLSGQFTSKDPGWTPEGPLLLQNNVSLTEVTRLGPQTDN